MIKCKEKIRGNQHGFLPHKSCTTQMTDFIDSLTLSLNENIRTDVVYFDFAKAFDSVNHDIILMKLKNEFKLDGTLLKFLVNYLKDRKQCVNIGGSKSGLKNVNQGCHKGQSLVHFFLSFS